jgi:hypothetical protein
MQYLKLQSVQIIYKQELTLINPQAYNLRFAT